MARVLKGLTVKQIEAFKEAGRYADGDSLYFIIDKKGYKQWVFYFPWLGKRREMGLGSYPEISLKEAREQRDDARKLVIKGIDPIAKRKGEKELALEANKMPSFEELANEFMESKLKEFRNDKHKAQWVSTLSTYCTSIANKKVAEITNKDVLAILKPIWETKNETASRLRGRIEKILDFAEFRGFREGKNPAEWQGLLEYSLPKKKKIDKDNFAALPYSEIPTLIAQLQEKPSISALALELCILTAMRTGEVRLLDWQEVDFETQTITIPANRMKAGREHRVPLTTRAMSILNELKRLTGEPKDGFVFRGRKDSRPISEMAMLMCLRGYRVGYTVHGTARSSFRDWTGEQTNFSRELCEQALAHQIGDAAELAYKRTDFLERRRPLMEAWAEYLSCKISI